MADEKSDVADDAVADLAESRQMDEQPFLEERRQRAVEVRRLRKLPEFLEQARYGICGAEKIREDAETVFDLAPEPKRSRPLGLCFWGQADPSLVLPAATQRSKHACEINRQSQRKE